MTQDAAVQHGDLKLSELQLRDHDLLVTISQQIISLCAEMARDRAESNARLAKSDLEFAQYRTKIEAEFVAYKAEVAKDIKGLREEIESLKTSRAQFYAVSTAMSFVTGLLVKIFWPK